MKSLSLLVALGLLLCLSSVARADVEACLDACEAAQSAGEAACSANYLPGSNGYNICINAVSSAAEACALTCLKPPPPRAGFKSTRPIVPFPTIDPSLPIN